MKKTLITLLLLPTICFAAVEFDLRKGVDLTATNFATASLLNQLVDAGTISATNKGAVIRRSGASGAYWPSVTDNPRYTNFLWLDLDTSPGSLKQYVCCGDVYTNWVISSVTPGSITTTEIKDYTILAVDMATNSVPGYAIQASAVDGNKIADNGIIAGKLSSASVTKGTFAFGAITGGDITNKGITYTNIADNTIGPDQMQNNAIGTLQLTNGAVTTLKIAGTNVTRDSIRDEAIGTLQLTNGAVTADKIAVGALGTNNFSTNVTYGIAKVYAAIGGPTNALTLLAGLNVASVQHLSEGKVRVNFTGSIGSTNYVTVVTLGNVTAGIGNLAYSFSNQVDSVIIDTRRSDTGSSRGSDINFWQVLIFSPN